MAARKSKYIPVLTFRGVSHLSKYFINISGKTLFSPSIKYSNESGFFIKMPEKTVDAEVGKKKNTI